VAVYLKYGMLALDGFFQDQVGSRVSASVATGLGNLFKYSFGLAIPFFPWSPLLLAALVAARPLLAATWRQHASAMTFALAWYAVLLVAFSSANWTRTRYMLPAFPFLSAMLSALLLAALDHPAVSRFAHRLIQTVIVFLLPLAGAFLFLALTLEKIRLGLAAAVLLLLGALITVALLRAAPRIRPALLALATFVIIWDIHYLVRPAFPSTPGYALVRALARSGCWRVYYPVQTADMTRLKTGYYKEKYASQVRLISRGTITVERLELPAYLKKARKLPIICVEEDLGLFPPERFKAVRAGAVNREDATISDFWKVLRAPKPRAAFRSLLIPYYIMIPLTPQAPERKPAS
jgi:4-amino-4-deoxy-L-arabinose transferase-like glycosyltransferase